MEKIFFIRMDSLFPTLFWANAIALLFLVMYRCRNEFPKERLLLAYLIIARMCHSFYYFVASGRGILPDWISVNCGNTMLFVGFYFEARAILELIKENTIRTDRLLRAVLVAAIVFFNALDYTMPSGGIRIAAASLGVVAIMALPNLRMLFSRDAGAFVKPTAILYSIFLVCLLARIVYGLQNRDVGILTTTILQSVTFLCLLLQIMISLPAYALILKDYAEEALLLMATTDRLTGATNRHAFLNAATAIYKNCKLFRTSLAVLFIDIDHFKQVNDCHGHAFGDRVLARMAVIIDKCLRESDLSCRYGGEEFVILLPRSDSSAARIVAQRIMNEAKRERFEERPDFTFTISVGVVCGVPLRDQDLDAVIHAADEAMYQAKREGRDRAIFREWDNEQTAPHPADVTAGVTADPPDPRNEQV